MNRSPASPAPVNAKSFKKHDIRPAWGPSPALFTHPCNGAGNDLHGDAEHPADQDQHGPDDMRLLAQHDDADGGKGRQRGAKGADGAEQFGGVDPGGRTVFSAIVGMKTELRRVYSEI